MRPLISLAFAILAVHFASGAWAQAETPSRCTTLLGLGKLEDAVKECDAGIADADQKLKSAKGAAAAALRRSLGTMLTDKGDALMRLARASDAFEAFERAAGLDPHPAKAYFNLCAAFFNGGNGALAMPACDKAIAADPKKADAYYIKGSVLIGASKTGPDGKLAAPAGTVEALKKYLALAPRGPHAADAKAMLDAVGAPSD